MSMNDGDDRELARLLADPSLWLEPGPAVEDSVLDAIRRSSSKGGAWIDVESV